MTYSKQRLGDLCCVRIGRTPRRDSPQFWGEAAIWVTVRELNGGVITSSNEQISDLAVREVMQAPIPAGTLLFSFKLSIGKMAIAGVPLYTNEAIAALDIRDANLLDRDYLRLALMANSSEDGANHAVLGKVLNKEKVEGIEIPVPPLDEQRRIVDLLSRAEGIVRLRREAEKKAAELIPALFLEMFGDPATNPKGWPVEPMGKHAGIPSVVRTPNIAAEPDLLCIGADSIESMTGKLLSRPAVRDVLPKSGKYWFDAGDVLYSKIRPYLTKATLAHSGGYCSADMYPLRCGQTLRPRFLLSLLLGRAFTEYATAESVRASMPKLNRETLFKYQFPVPPLGLQDVFAERAEAICAIQSQQSAATAKAQATFDALLAGVFNDRRGE